MTKTPSGYGPIWRNSKTIAAGKAIMRGYQGTKAVYDTINSINSAVKKIALVLPKRGQPQVVKEVKYFPSKKKGKINNSYRTTGYIQKAPKPKKFIKKDFYAETGSKALIERGGTQSDADAVYLGSSTTPIGLMYSSIFRAIIKNLFTQMGQRISSFEQLVPTTNGQWSIGYTYFQSTDSTTQSSGTAVDVLSTHTYSTLSEALLSAITAFFTNTTIHQFVEFFVQDTTNYGSAVMRKATLRVEDATLYLDTWVNFKLQNRTLAQTGLSAEDEDATNVANNPVKGKLYQGNFSGFLPRYRTPGTLANWGDGFIGAVESGLIVKDADDGDSTQIKKPPAPSYFRNCTKCTNVLLNPGEIKYHKLSYKSKMSLNTFFGKYYKELNTSATQDIVYLGKCFMFGLEKSLDSRDSDSNVSIGWEMTHGINSAITAKAKTHSTTLLTVI